MVSKTTNTGTTFYRYFIQEGCTSIKANARTVSEILEREYNFSVSRSRVRLWLADLEKQYEQKSKDVELAELLAEAESDKVKELKNTNERLLTAN